MHNVQVRLDLMGIIAKNATNISGNDAVKISREGVEVEKRHIVKGTLHEEFIEPLHGFSSEVYIL